MNGSNSGPHVSSPGASALLQTVFLRTSTPVHQPPDSWKKPYHRDRAQQHHRMLACSLDTRKSSQHRSNNNFINGGGARPRRLQGPRDDRRLYLSLYNLTHDSHYQPATLSQQPAIISEINPTHFFFSNSKSFASLTETNLDSGANESTVLYKETDLDRYSVSHRSRSLQRLGGQGGLSLCPGLDEDVLNRSEPCGGPGSGGSSSSRLVRRLYDSAHSPAQLRVARSATRLHVPAWLDSVADFGARGDAALSLPLPFAAPVSADRSPRLAATPRELPHATAAATLPTPQPKKAVPAGPWLRSATMASTSSARTQNQTTRIQPILVCRARAALAASTQAHPDLDELGSLFLDDVRRHEPVAAFPRFRNSSRTATSHQQVGGRVCWRLSCGRIVEMKAQPSAPETRCDYCEEAVYCSERCTSLDRVSHDTSCAHGLLRDWLNCALVRLSARQLNLLARFYEMATSASISAASIPGEVRFRLEESPAHCQSPPQYIVSPSPSSRTNGFTVTFTATPRGACVSTVRPLRVSRQISTESSSKYYNMRHPDLPNSGPIALSPQASSLGSLSTSSRTMVAQVKKNRKVFLFGSASSSSPTSSTTTSTTKPHLSLMSPPGTPIYSQNPPLSPTQSFTHSVSPQSKSPPPLSRMSSYDRQLVFQRVQELLQSHNIDLQQSYPGIYFRLADYVSRGCLFPPQKVCVVSANLLIGIRPDEAPDCSPLS